MMKKCLYIVSAFLAACAPLTPEEAPSGLVSMSFTAAPEPVSRTNLDNSFGIRWSTSDAVSIFASTGAQGSRFKVSGTESDGAVATFEGLSRESSNGYYYALYPASDAARLVTSSGTVSAVLPTTQTGVRDSFAAEANLSLARVNADAQADNDILHFKNAGALLSFLVPGNYITRVKIESRDGSVAMSGPANISYNDGAPSVSPTTSAKNYVEVKVPSGSAGKRFYAVAYPGNYSQGFIVSFYADQTFNRYRSSKAASLGRNGILRLIEKNWTVNDDRAQSESGTELIAPAIVSGGPSSATSASLSFNCSSGKRDTYKLYRRDASSMSEGTLVKTLNTGSGQYGNYTYKFSGLTTGACYDFGVSASCSADPSYADSPVTWLEDVTINAALSGMSLTIESAAANYYNFVVNYVIAGLSSTSAEHGLVFSYDNSSPTCEAVGEEGKLPGPALNSTGSVSLCQCIPNACLRPGQACHLRAYCFDSATGEYIYSPVQSLVLPSQPEGYPISKSALSSPAPGILLSSFTADGKWDGYVAEADCGASSPIRFGVNNVKMGTVSAISMASQLSSSGALVLVNGQIFGGQGNIGMAYTGGNLRYNNSSDDGISACSSYGNNSSSWQPVTRAILGVDASGKPGAYWCSLSGGSPRFFDRPIPAGSAVYPQVSATSGPGPARSWSPAEALSTGPMLLYGGNVCVSEDKISTGVYYTNYELWDTSSGGIYGSSRQRTALGFDSQSGRMYLAVVKSNCTQTALARIMKGLGCDYAMNLDGGGSTQMQVAGTGALTSNTRSVKSTAGFFAR